MDRSKIKIKDYESYYFGVWCGHQDAIDVLEQSLRDLKRWQAKADAQMEDSKDKVIHDPKTP